MSDNSSPALPQVPLGIQPSNNQSSNNQSSNSQSSNRQSSNNQSSNNQSSNIAMFTGKWKGSIGSRLVVIEIDTTKLTNEMVGWYTFIGNDSTPLGERTLFSSVKVSNDFMTLVSLSEQLTIRGWIASASCSGSQFVGTYTWGIGTLIDSGSSFFIKFRSDE